MIGDCKGKSSNWSSNDTTTVEGAQLDYLTSLYGNEASYNWTNAYFEKLF